MEYVTLFFFGNYNTNYSYLNDIEQQRTALKYTGCFMVKEKIGNYELVGSLGRGSFGSVYKAVTNDGDLVAVKILNPQLLYNRKAVDDFFNEARILSKLDHPNICKFIDFFPYGPDYTIVMEYVDGADLKELMSLESNYPLPFEKASRIAGQCLTAFQYAYEKGILHMDIKPSNIIIDKNGNSIILDFGIATISGDAKASRVQSVSYSSPERFNREGSADIRSDIYSLGMVFYELFTGRRPFDANNTLQIQSWHQHEIPASPDIYNPALSPNIAAAIKTALEKEPVNRFHDFLEFKEAMALPKGI